MNDVRLFDNLEAGRRQRTSPRARVRSVCFVPADRAGCRESRRTPGYRGFGDVAAVAVSAASRCNIGSSAVRISTATGILRLRAVVFSSRRSFLEMRNVNGQLLAVPSCDEGARCGMASLPFLSDGESPLARFQVGHQSPGRRIPSSDSGDLKCPRPRPPPL